MSHPSPYGETAGEPPAAAKRALDRIYNFTPSSTSFEDAAPLAGDREELPEARSKLSPPLAFHSAVRPAEDQISAEDKRTLRRLRESTSSLTLRVNNVELTWEVVDVDRTAESICCLVRQNGQRCKLPRSENVEIELEGKVHRTAFLGSWHALDWLGLYIGVFPILPEQ